MDKQTLEIGHPLKVAVYWYDKVPEPPSNETYEGEVVGWKDSQMVVRVPNYAVLRFWKNRIVERVQTTALTHLPIEPEPPPGRVCQEIWGLEKLRQMHHLALSL